MLYVGQIVANKNRIQVRSRFEESVQNFLVEVGQMPANEVGTSAERQISILNVDNMTNNHLVKQEHIEELLDDAESSDEVESLSVGGSKDDAKSSNKDKSLSKGKSKDDAESSG
jgi:hypothetical protein